MDTTELTNRLFAGFAGICLALFIAACTSVSDEQAAGSGSATPGEPMPGSFGQSSGRESSSEKLEGIVDNEPDDSNAQSSDGNLHEIVVTARRTGDSAATGGVDSVAQTSPAVDASEEEIERFRSQARDLGRDDPQRIATPGSANALSLDMQVIDDVAVLARIEPGEEVWIISRGGVTAQPAVDTDSPGTGAMLASIVVPNPGPSRGRATRIVPLPLQHTDVKAQINGYISAVDVTQQFSNPYDQKIEAIYMFPLPETAAVNEFVMTIGERRIRGILRERKQAEQIYAQARSQGYQASLLTQHRPNIFEQQVANIEPGHRIDVNIRYFHTLKFADGWYSFVFPTIVGPRYNPPGSSDPIDALPRTTFAPRNTGVHYLAPNERSGHDISIQVDVAPGVEIEEINSTHAISQSARSEDLASVRLANQSTIPNRDFVLNFRVAGERIKSNLMTYVDPETQEGYFTLMMYPPSELQSLQRQPLELVFVLDCSGSMRGEPMRQSKAAILAALRELRPYDTFQIIRFSNNASQLGPVPIQATRENIRQAERFVRGLSGNGGTQMIEGIKAALDFPHDEERLRFVTFLTDGYIGNEAEILGAVHDRLGASRIFSFGVGSSVNRYLLERMATMGRGAVAYLGPQDSGTEVMDFFFDRISHPAMIDVEIDWNGMRVSDVYPSRLPDLFVGRSVVVTGRFSGNARTPTIRGRAAGERIAMDLPLTVGDEEHAYIAPTWARLKIADLKDRQTWVSDPYGALADQIRQTALTHNLMSDYTSFVAVDASQQTDGGYGTTVYQAVPVPQGVRYETTVNQ